MVTRVGEPYSQYSFILVGTIRGMAIGVGFGGGILQYNFILVG